MEYEICIIGGGASGMMAAASAAEEVPGEQIVIIEKNEEMVRKLLATGNGRCNLTHLHSGAENYSNYEDTRLFLRRCFQVFDDNDALLFFERMGLWCGIPDREGRFYPLTEQAVDVRDALEGQLRRHGVHMRLNTEVVKVSQNEARSVFLIEAKAGDGAQKTLTASRLVVATGGRAGMQYGSTGDGYGFSKSMGHTLKPPRPVLVQTEVAGREAELFKQAKGVRVNGIVTLYRNGELVESEEGEAQFTSDGLSGICVYNLTRYMEAVRDGARYSIALNLFPGQQQELLLRLAERRDLLSGEPVTLFFRGIVHSKLIEPCLGLLGVDGKRLAGGLTDEELQEIGTPLTDMRFPLAGTKGWKEAQVTAGGVHLGEVESTSMESKLVPGLFLTGELLDVDGPCGGVQPSVGVDVGISGGQERGKGDRECLEFNRLNCI